MEDVYKLVNPRTRIFVRNIPSNVEESNLIKFLNFEGDIEVYLYNPGKYNDGWAWIGFQDEKAAVSAVSSRRSTQVSDIW